MSQNHLSDELLQRHFDGDLDSTEEAEAQEHLADCSECNVRLEQLGRLQRLIRMAAEDSASNVSEVSWQGAWLEAGKKDDAR